MGRSEPELKVSHIACMHNLLRDGYERTASLILWRLRDRNDSAMVFVKPTGGWLMRSTVPDTELPDKIARWVGTYNRDTPPEFIEDDLLERLRELNEGRIL